jgi:hypothetical protein
MNRKSLVASFGLVACLAAALLAQAPSSNGKVDQKAVQSIRVKVIGCVAGDAKAGRYILRGAFLSGDDVPSTVGTAGKKGSGKDLSFENSLYGLMATTRATWGLRRPARIRAMAPPMETPLSVASRRSSASRNPSTESAKNSASYRALGMSE